MEFRGSWLCPTPVERERLLEMEKKIGTSRAVMFVAVAIGLFLAIPWYGPLTLLPLAWVVVSYPLLRPWVARSARPEFPLMAAVLNAQVTIGIAISVTGGPHSPALPFLMLAIVTVSARFSQRGVIVGASASVAVLLAATVGVAPSQYLADPALVNACVVTVIGLAAGLFALQRDAVRQRTHAVLDPLTGLLNRKALLDRFDQVAQHAAAANGHVALIAGDLDEFKRINDEHGHECGDRVLVELADLLRDTLRAFDLICRLGGEEFVMVLPGATVDDACRVAEGVRAAVAAARPAGLELTISLGVAAAQGTGVQFETMRREADLELYRAKHEGRNRVCPGTRSASSRADPGLVH